MPTRLTVFVSSTVRDFGPVRRDIRGWLRRRKIEVRESEDPEFPVDPAVHSHDACLRAIEGCHVFLLLVGWRYGGLYRQTLQSITWREYDEARRLNIPIVAMVLRDVADEATRLAQARRGLAASFTTLDPAVVRFLDAIRKGHVDNWIHLDWDGSFAHLRHCLDARLNTLFVNYQRPHWKLERQARRLEPYVIARGLVDSYVGRADSKLSAPGGRRDLANELCELLVKCRSALFDFAPNDRYNFVIYRRTKSELEVFARAHHPEIAVRNRSWPVGIGHIGIAAEKAETLVASNLQQTKDWRGEFTTDGENYVSAICTPIADKGVLAITTNRADQFKSQQQIEVLTAKSLASMLSLKGVLD